MANRGVRPRKKQEVWQMKRMMSLVLALVIAAGILCVTGTAFAIDTLYVKTGNGGKLNVRDVVTNKVIGQLDYGANVAVERYSGDWAIIVWGSYGDAKVMKKFLVTKDPGKYVGPTDEDGNVLKDSALGSETVEGMNKQYSLMRYVQSYTVITVPANRTGTVNLRWGPSKNTNLVMKAPADYELEVLAESKNWLMCSDPATGRICYVARKYTNAP